MSLLLPPANRHVPVTDDKYLHATDDEMRGRYLRSFSRVVRVKKKTQTFECDMATQAHEI